MIIAFANSRYKIIALNWVAHLKICGINDYIIYSLDEDCYKFLYNNQINTEFLKSDMFNKKLNFRQRLNKIYELLDNEINVLHSDLDAIWLKDPINFISDNYDIVSSVGTFPKNTFDKLGFTLCMGWMYYQANSIIKKIFQNTIKSKNKSLNDQEIFNNVLFNSELQYSVNDINLNEKEIIFNDFKIKALNQKIISRNEPRCDYTYVCHPLSSTNIDREKFLKEQNLWII